MSTYLDNGYSNLLDVENQDSGQVNSANIDEKIDDGVISFNKTTLGKLIGNQNIQSENFVTGVLGWRISGDGDVEFNDGVFRGDVSVDSLHIPDQDTTNNSFHTNSTGNSWWGCTETNFNANNDNADAYILNTGVAKFQAATIVAGIIDGTSTIDGRAASTIAAAINSDGNLITDVINSRLDSSAKRILSDFDFGAVDYAGAVKAGDIAWNTSTGVITSGSGVAVYRNGIVGAQDGVATFTIGTDGSAYFSGEIAASDITGGTLTGATIYVNGDAIRLRDDDENQVGYLYGGSSTELRLIAATTVEGGGSVDLVMDASSTKIKCKALYFEPTTDAERDLGEYDYAWRNVYCWTLNLKTRTDAPTSLTESSIWVENDGAHVHLGGTEYTLDMTPIGEVPVGEENGVHLYLGGSEYLLNTTPVSSEPELDFITTCNWTATGTYTLRAFRGSATNVVTSYSLYYRKKGTSAWIETTNGQVIIDSTGEWEIGNSWNKSGNDVLTHSYYGITAINSCTDVYFNEETLGVTVGIYFLLYCWYNCSNLTSMPDGFSLPPGITSVGAGFLAYCWYNCSKLTSMPVGFNLPSSITSIGDAFLSGAWQGCTTLASMPDGFSVPSSIINAGEGFLSFCWDNCSNLTSMPDGFTIPLGITSIGGSFLRGTWTNCASLTAMPSGFSLPSIVDSVGGHFLRLTWYGCISLTAMPSGFNLPSSLISVGEYALSGCWQNCTSLTSMPAGFSVPPDITSVGDYFLSECWRGCTSLTSMPDGFNLQSSITSIGTNFLNGCWRGCTSLVSMPDGFNMPTSIPNDSSNFLYYSWQGCSALTSMPAGFNLPQNITSVGFSFLFNTWRECTSLASMPDGFNLPENLTSSQSNFLAFCWSGCTSLTAMPAGFNIPEGFVGSASGFLYASWQSCTSLASMPDGFNLPSGLYSNGYDFLRNTWSSCTSLIEMPAGFNLPDWSHGFSYGDNSLMSTWRDCTSLTTMPTGFNLPSNLAGAGNNVFYECWRGCTSLVSMPVGFNMPSGLSSVNARFMQGCWYGCNNLTTMPSGFNLPSSITSVGSYFLDFCWYNCSKLKQDGSTENITFEFSSYLTFGGTCSISPASITASKASPYNVAVNRPA